MIPNPLNRTPVLLTDTSNTNVTQTVLENVESRWIKNMKFSFTQRKPLHKSLLTWVYIGFLIRIINANVQHENTIMLYSLVLIKQKVNEAISFNFKCVSHAQRRQKIYCITIRKLAGYNLCQFRLAWEN